jgi:hypothetical protein
MTTPQKCEIWPVVFLLTKPLRARPPSLESATLRVYEKLRQSLGEFAGVAGFQSLASRALALARVGSSQS